MIRRLVIGSKNQKKIREMRTLIVPEWNRPKWAEGLEIVGMEGYPDAPDPEESGATFGENARI
ncbi:MAG: Ham1 family, partial [Planctomycetota bacterium]